MVGNYKISKIQKKKTCPERATQFAINVYNYNGPFLLVNSYPIRFMFSLLTPDRSKIKNFQLVHGALEHSTLDDILDLGPKFFLFQI